MTVEELQKRLDVYQHMCGCRRKVDDPLNAGYLTIMRRRVSPVSSADPHEEPEDFAKWEALSKDVKQRPYLVNVYEVNAEADEAELDGTIDYMAPEDYVTAENFYMSSLTELPDLLARFDKTLDDLIPQSELRAP